MKTKLILAGVLGVSAVFGGGYVLGQGAGKVSTATILSDYDAAANELDKYQHSLTMARLTEGAEHDKYLAEATALSNSPAQYAAVTAAAMKDSTATSFLLGKQIANYRIAHGDSRSAPQASQVANEATVELLILQTSQNQRIIELLEEINAKKK